MVRHWFPLSFLLKLLILIAIIVALMMAIFFYMAGTDGGTKFILDKIGSETNIRFKYGDGNLRDGLWVTDIDIKATDDLEVLVDKAYVKIGWRAIFAKEVHLSSVNVNDIEIINKKPATGEPFDYKTLKLPVNLRVDTAKVNRIVYKQAPRDPVVIHDITARNLAWVGSKLVVGSANLSYGELVNVRSLQGNIDFQGDYPLDLTAIAEVSTLEKVYIDPLNITATGSLKRAVAKVKSRYNEGDVEGEVVVQALDKGTPFQAKLRWDNVLIPYLESQNIHLKSGILTAEGVLSEVRLRINSELTAKDIPSGHYQGRAVLVDKELKVDRLEARVPEGNLLLNGTLNWKYSFDANVTATSRQFNLQQVIPKAYSQYKVYAPKYLNGKLAFHYQQKNTTGNTQINADLRQKDGEHINAKLIRGKALAKSKQAPPWYIDANWQQLIRHNLPNIGEVDSPSGRASVIINGSKLTVDAHATINKLNAAPKGVYDVRAQKSGDNIAISHLDYNGVVGNLSGSGNLVLATKQKPLSWQIDATTKGLLPKKYNASLPLERLSGRISARGQMVDISKGGVKGQRHIFSFTNTDLSADLDASLKARVVRITGNGDASVDMVGGNLDKFDARFDGHVDTKDVPKGRLIIDANGTPKLINIKNVNYLGEAGAVQAKGVVDLRQNIGWRVSGRFDKFNLGYFLPENPAVISGNLTSTGAWKSAPKNSKAAGSLENFTVDFDGSLNGSFAGQKIPAGNLKVKAAGTPKLIRIDQLNYSGEAGAANAKGTIDLRRNIGWNVSGHFDKFNVGYFLPNNPVIVTGDLVSNGSWQPAAKNSKSGGSLQNFAVDFDGRLNGKLNDKALPEGTLQIKAAGNTKKITIERLSHHGAAGDIDAKGVVNLQNGISWNISATMNRFNLGFFVKDVPSLVTGSVVSDGRWGKNQQTINLNQLDLSGTIKGQPLSAKGSLSAKLHLPSDLAGYFKKLQAQEAAQQYQQVNALIEQLNADNLVVRWGNNYLTANGNAKNLQANINITSLDQLSPKLGGKVAGGISILQPQGQALPTLYIDLVGERITFPGLILRQGHIRGKIVNLATSPSQLVVHAEGLEVANQSFSRLDASFEGTEQSHNVDIDVANEQLDFMAQLKGGFNRDQLSWSGAIGGGQLKSKYATLDQLQPAQLIVNLPKTNKGKTSDLSVKLAAHCWQAEDQSGKLCLRENLLASAASGQVNLAVQNLDTSLFAVFLPKDIDWHGKINGRAILDWQKGRPPNINTTLYSDNGKVGLIQDGDAEPISLPYQRVSLIAMSVPEGLKLRSDINTGRGARGYAEVIVDPYKPDKPISGALVLNELNLAVFKPFFPGMRVLEGNITMAGGLGGSLTKPQFYGDVKLAKGRIAMLDLPINLTQVNATAKIRGTDAVIDGKFNSGTGTGALSGNVNWQQKLQAKLSITGERLVLTQPPLLLAEVNPDIDIIVRPADRYVNIEGAVSVPSATIRPPEASEDIITQTEDAVVLDRRLIGNIDEVLKVTKPWSINADIGIDLGDDINFRGFGAVIPLAGALNVSQHGQGVMRAKGVIQVSRRTNVNIFGQGLELNYGQVRFNGDVMKPNLSIEAAKTISGKTVGLRVKGNTASPNIVVFNNAGLTQQQAMNALVTGRIDNTGATQISEQGFKSEVTNNLAAAGLSFGLSGTRSLTNQIGQAFGLQSLIVDASGNSEDTNVNVTGYVTPDLYIRYGVGVFNAQNSLSIRYQLTRRIYVEATSAAENAVDVVYSWQF